MVPFNAIISRETGSGLGGKPVMGAFVSAGSRTSAVALVASITFFQSIMGTGFAEELSAPDPFKKAKDRLQNLSTFVDSHLQKVQTVNKSVSTKIAGAKNSSMDISAFSQIGGGNRTIANMMRLNDLDSASNFLKLDFLQNHQQKLQEFSNQLRQAQTDVATLSPADAKQKLDAIMVPNDMQIILQLGTDGRTLPPPPHLQGTSLSTTSLTPYVVGPGSAATVDYPSVAEIAYAYQGYGAAAVCTGTLISSTAVLTAAHCFCNNVKKTTATDCLSATYKRGQEDVKPDDKRFISVFFHDHGAIPVDQIIINPDYNLPKKDLAIIKLAKEITDIMPAPLNTVRTLKPGEFATIVGFGRHSPLKSDGTPQPGPPVDDSEGLKLWATIKTAACNLGPLFDEDICWNYQLRNEDKITGNTCYGDSGGPAFATIDGAVKLVGVTSEGALDCRAGGVQSADIDIFKNVNWIISVAGANASPAFMANLNAFVSNPAVRAYGAPYHLFINRPDSSNGTFGITNSSGSLSVSVNTTPTFASLTIQLTAPNATTPACSTTVSDAFATCTVQSPATGDWTVRITGASPQESQVVAAVSH